MEGSKTAERDGTWLVAFGTLSLGVSVAVSRYHGNAVDFAAGFFLGVSLAVSAGYLVICLVRRARR